MCLPSEQIDYISTDAILPIKTRFHEKKLKKPPDEGSQTSSFDLSWIEPLPEFSLQNQTSISLPKFSDFEWIGRLGNGASAQVYCVRHSLSGKYFAIKIADGRNEQVRQQIEVEKQILFRHSHGNPYMIKPYCAFHQGVRFLLKIV